MRNLLFTAIGAVDLFGVWGVAHGRGGRAAVPAPQQAAAAPSGKAAYFPHADIESTWKDLEARQGINKRVLDGGAYSVNIPIDKEGAAPRVHASPANVWITMEGSA